MGGAKYKSGGGCIMNSHYYPTYEKRVYANINKFLYALYV